MNQIENRFIEQVRFMALYRASLWYRGRTRRNFDYIMNQNKYGS